MYDNPFNMFAPFMIVTGVVLFLIGAIYLISRARSDQVHFSFRHALEGYFYLMTVISFIIFSFGMIFLLNAGLSGVLGKDFSYGRPLPYYAYPAKPVPAPPPYPPGEVTGKAEVLTPEQQEELRKKEEQRQIEEHRKQQGRNFREGITQGIGMSFVGGVVWVLHIWGRRKFYGAANDFSRGIRRAYLVVMLVIFSIMGIVAITSAVSRVLRQYVLYDIDRYSFSPAPGAMVAAGIVFIPVWIYYLSSLINELKKKENEGKA